VSILLALLTACGPGSAPPEPDNDRDGDGILDLHEGFGDTDGDGVVDAEDLDSDGDGLADAIERGDDVLLTLPFDTDGDGTPDFQDTDSDGNGIADGEERFRSRPESDADGDGLLDAHDLDDDNDGAPDLLEMLRAGADRDSDQDGDVDRYDTDSDDDGVPDHVEAGPIVQGALYDHDQDGTPDGLDLDSDDDGLTDAEERGTGSTPADTDGDGRWNGRDVDSDNDGVHDWQDHVHADPLRVDTDGDGVRDGVELQLATDPRDPGSVPDAPAHRIDPRTEREESEALTVEVGQRRVDVIYVAAGQELELRERGEVVWRSSEHQQTIIRRLSERLVTSDVLIGAGLFNGIEPTTLERAWSYGIDTRGPWLPLHRVTDQQEVVNQGLERWPERLLDGVDGGIEAISQALFGPGYDMNCDGRFDERADVRPWSASPTDPFGGRAADQRSLLGEGSGDLPGLGRRPYAMPIIVYSSTTAIVTDWGGPLDRLPEGSDPTPGCPAPLQSTQVARRLDELGGKVVLYDYAGLMHNIGVSRFVEVFDAYGDLDGDGEADDPLVIRGGSTVDTEASIDPMIDQLEHVIQTAIASRTFSEVQFAVTGDEPGFVVRMSPERVPIEDGETVTIPVTLDFRGVVPPTAQDQVFRLELVAAGDGVVSLGSRPFYIVVPGRGLE